MNAPHQHDLRCQELFAMLSEYVDGELPAETCAEIEAHFSGCAPCVEFIANFKQTIQLTHDWRAGVAPAPLSEERRTALEQAWKEALQRRCE